MKSHRKLILAPHDDGGGAFAVLCRLARAMVRVAEESGLVLHIYCLNSSAAEGGQGRLDDLIQASRSDARYVPVDNLIRLPKDETTAAVLGERIPDLLQERVRPLWRSWPCEPDGIALSLRKLEPRLWRDVALGISMGVPQLHRVARREGFPSIEVGDWFFSVGLRGCMEESSVPPEVIAATEADLKIIEEDELLAREAWLTLYQAPQVAYQEHLAGSQVELKMMEGTIWSGDPLPAEGIAGWKVARDLRAELDRHICNLRGVAADRVRFAYIVTGKTGVWNAVVRTLKETRKKGTERVAVVDLHRGTRTVTFLEDGGQPFVSTVLKRVSYEERHLAMCRAVDFGVSRTAGGVLGFVETRRPSVFVDEPGHWLGRIQRQQCHQAGLCVVIPVQQFLKDPDGAIQEQADKLGTDSDLDRTAAAAAKVPVGAERDLAEYLLATYRPPGARRVAVP